MNTDFGTNVSVAVEAGHMLLSGRELIKEIADKTVLGEYGMDFRYVSWIGKDGTLEGKNNVGSHVFGTWSVDEAEHTLSLLWDGGWDDTTTQAYIGGGQIRYYDIGTGNWRTTFTNISERKQHPLVVPN
ncbi:MAG: hypothetical protein V3V25_03270 [Paracoccaceae bacterium]